MLDEVLVKLFTLTCDTTIGVPPDYHDNYFVNGFTETEEFVNTFPSGVDVKGKRILDYGCGLGSTCVYFAQQGARSVTGIDPSASFIAFAKRRLTAEYPDLEDTVTFTTDIDTLARAQYDIIISKDTLEHVESPSDYIADVARLLKPGGVFYAGFGPTWNSPYGGHGRMRTQMPWAHLIFPERVIIKGLATIDPQFNCNTIQEMGLSQLALKELRRIVAGSGLKLTFFRANRGKSRKNRIMTLMRTIPPLEEYFTYNVFFILEKI